MMATDGDLLQTRIAAVGIAARPSPYAELSAPRLVRKGRDRCLFRWRVGYRN